MVLLTEAMCLTSKVMAIKQIINFIFASDRSAQNWYFRLKNGRL